MGLQVYVRHPDETSLLIDEPSDLEEAIALCSDLVAVDGYERAEVWSEEGDRLYAVEREGAALRTIATPGAFVPPPPRAPNVADMLPPRREPPADVVAPPPAAPLPPAPPPSAPLPVEPTQAVSSPAALPPAALAAEPPADSPPLPVEGVRILGERPDQKERWLGL